MDTERRFELEQERAAAEQAASIGGRAAEQNLDPAERPAIEGGGGSAERFEEAERALAEHASRGDEQPAHAILHDESPRQEPGTAARTPRLTRSTPASAKTTAEKVTLYPLSQPPCGSPARERNRSSSHAALRGANASQSLLK